jgi:hypothetical protein
LLFLNHAQKWPVFGLLARSLLRVRAPDFFIDCLENHADLITPRFSQVNIMGLV